MIIGSLQYPPDYKSDKKYPDMKKVFQGMENRAEIQRLERDVVDAAKVLTNEANEQWDRVVSYQKLHAAVVALKEFEGRQ